MKIAHEGFPTITIVGVCTAVALMLSWSYLPLVISISLSSILLPVWFLSIYFFRDPERTLPIDLSEEVLLSPADGKVVVVKEVESVEYLEQEAIQISIFLSFPIECTYQSHPSEWYFGVSGLSNRRIFNGMG